MPRERCLSLAVLRTQRSLAYFKHGIELAEVLGCDRMSINSGWGDWDEDREEAWKRSREHLSILAEYAGEHGLVLTMESLRPEESNLVTTVSDAKRMIDEVASPYLQPMVDTTAMGVAGETLEDWFATFGDGAIHEMHFIDGDPYGHLVWGDGKHDMDAFVATLNAHGFDGMLGQEITDGRYYDDPAAADAKNMAAFEKYLID